MDLFYNTHFQSIFDNHWKIVKFAINLDIMGLIHNTSLSLECKNCKIICLFESNLA